MADLIFVAVVIAFFALAVAFVKACDHVIGPDPMPDATSPAHDADAVAPEVRG